MVGNMKLLVFLFMIITALFVSCKKSQFTTKSNEGKLVISNTIIHPQIRTMTIFSTMQFQDEELSLFADIDRTSGLIAHLVYRNDEFYAQIRNPDLSLKQEKILKYGKGPGEWNRIAGIYYDTGEFGFLEMNKRTIELFNNDLIYKDTILIKDSMRLYFNPSSVNKTGNEYIVSPTVPHYLVKMNEDGTFTAKDKTELDENDKETFMKLFGWNASVARTDADGNIYLVLTGRENRYELRKYANELKTVWTNVIQDEYLDVLSPKIVRLKDGSVKPSRAGVANSIDVDETYVYILRGVGGYIQWDENNKQVISTIPGLKNGFIDVINKNTGKYEYRIDAPFLMTDVKYTMRKFGDRFYFFAYPEYNDSTVKEGTNRIIVAEVTKYDK